MTLSDNKTCTLQDKQRQLYAKLMYTYTYTLWKTAASQGYSRNLL